MMNDSESETERKIAGCGLTILAFLAVAVLGIVAGVVYVLFMAGSWIGGQ